MPCPTGAGTGGGARLPPGGEAVEQGATILRQSGIPVVRYPDDAARAFQHLWSYSKNLQALYETPASCASESIDVQSARSVIENARREQRTLLSEAEAKRILAAYGIPVASTEIAATPHDAVAHAGEPSRALHALLVHVKAQHLDEQHLR